MLVKLIAFKNNEEIFIAMLFGLSCSCSLQKRTYRVCLTHNLKPLHIPFEFVGQRSTKSEYSCSKKCVQFNEDIVGTQR